MKAKLIFSSFSIILLLGSALHIKEWKTDIKVLTEKEDTIYRSHLSKEDCYLCGDPSGTMLSLYRGEDNLGIIDINTFELYHININGYDDEGNLNIQLGSSSWQLYRLKEGELNVAGKTNPNRGYFFGDVFLDEYHVIDIEKVSTFLCSDCINAVLWKDTSEQYNIGIINFKTKEIKLLSRDIVGYTFDNYYVSSRYHENRQKFDLDIFYCPPRLDEE